MSAGYGERTPVGPVTWVWGHEELLHLVSAAHRASEAVYDLETTGLDEYAREGGTANGGVGARIVLASFTLPLEGRHYIPGEKDPTTWVLPLSHPDSPHLGRWRDALLRVLRALIDADVPIVGHNVKFDNRWVHALLNVDLAPHTVWDTMVSSHLLEENSTTRLKVRAAAEFGVAEWDDFDLSTPGAAERVNLIHLGEYAARDTYYTWRLLQRHRERMWLATNPNEPSAQETPEAPEEIQEARLGQVATWVAMPTVASLTRIEQNGILLDTDWVRATLADDEKRAAETLKEMADRYPNANIRGQASAAPTSTWFRAWTDAAVDAGDLTIAALTPNGKPQWSRAVLTRQARNGSEAAQLVLDHRHHSKRAEFLRAWLDHAHGGIIRANYHVGRVATGRLSSSDPNMQQVSRELRGAFIPRKGYHLADFDYSQIELRTAAFVSRSTPMIQAFQDGKDLHTMLAREIVQRRENKLAEKENRPPKDIALTDVTPGERQAGKCFHPSTEVLTRTGWKRILDLAEGEEIVQGHPQDDGTMKLSWVVPWQVYSQMNEHDYLVELLNEGMDLLVTPDHGLLARSKAGRWERRLPDDMQKARHWLNAGHLDGDHEVDEHLLRVAVMVHTEGHYEKERIRLGFTDETKIDRCRELLRAAGLRFTEYSGTKITGFTFTRSCVDHLLDDKRLPWWWLNLSESSREAVLDEVQYWGESRINARSFTRYFSWLHDVDVMQALASVTGRKTHDYGDGRLSIRATDRTRGGNLDVTWMPYRGLVACLAVDSGVVLVRRGGKTQVTYQSANFGLLYGMSAIGFREYAEDVYGVMLTIDEAVEVRDAFFTMWEGIRDWHQVTIAKVHRDGYVTSPIGRVRRLPDIWDSNDRMVSYSERAAINSPVQGFASDLMQMAAASVQGLLPGTETIPHVRLVATVHDSIVAEVPVHGWEEIVAEVQRRMVQLDRPLARMGVHLDVPLVADVKVGTRWGLSDVSKGK